MLYVYSVFYPVFCNYLCSIQKLNNRSVVNKLIIHICMKLFIGMGVALSSCTCYHMLWVIHPMYPSESS